MSELKTRIYNPLDSEVQENPYPVYRHFRENYPLVNTVISEKMKLWFVFRYDDVAAILKDLRFGRSAVGKIPQEQLGKISPEFKPVVDLLMGSMLNQDPPGHTHLRKIIGKAFASFLANKKMERTIEQAADSLIDDVLQKREIDFISDFAAPLPLMINAAVLGVPEQDRMKLKKWANFLFHIIDLNPQKEQVRADGILAMEEMKAYFRNLITLRKKNPEDDLITAMIHAEDNREKLNEEELIANCGLFVGAGHETTISALGNGMFALLKNPEQMEMLCKNPQLMPTAVEEMLRYDSPIQFVSRFAFEDVDMGEMKIPKGGLVAVVLGSANRDSKYFNDAENFDIQRHPNPHLAFGFGGHLCLGQNLARTEIQLALKLFFEKIKKVEMKGNFQRKRMTAFRGLESLPLSIQPN